MLSILRSIFAPPDPMRFSGESTPPPNWNGELERDAFELTGAVLVDEGRRCFEFGRKDIIVDSDLTELDKRELRKRGLDPYGDFAVTYSECKKYFSRMPLCKKHEMASHIKTIDNCPDIAPETAKDVLAAFRAHLTAKPTF